MCLLAEPSLAQHTLQRTLTVDPSGNADFTTIQAAINSPRIGSDPTTRFTVLIYPGTYAESLTLDGTKENVDLVGVDRDAVIIAPPSGNGLTITSGTESARNNTIRNLTIRTTDGHGIEISKGSGPGDQTPAEIVIEDCTIEANGEGKDGAHGEQATDTLVAGCEIESKAGIGIRAGTRWTVARSWLEASGSAVSSTRQALRVGTSDDVSIVGCTLKSVRICIQTGGGRTRVQNSMLYSTGAAGPSNGVITFNGAADPVVASCILVNDASNSPIAASIAGVFLEEGDGIEGTGTIVNTIISVIGSDITQSATGIQIDKLPGVLRIIDCDIEVDVSNSTAVSPAARGIDYKCSAPPGGCGPCDVIGGSVRTTVVANKAVEVYDLDRSTPSAHLLRVHGTRFSKWGRSLKSAGRPVSMVQRTLNVAAPSDGSVFATTSLTSSEQEITTGITSPDVYRVLSAKGSTAGMSQAVYIVGTNFAGDQITDAIDLNGTSIAVGRKAFQTVSMVILPAQTGPGQSVSVGVSSRLGLQFPISSSSDVLQIGRKAAGANSYTIDLLANFSIDDDFATVAPETITSGDSFEFVVLSSQ